MKTITVTVMGGDARQGAVADYFARRGARVRCFGVPSAEPRQGIFVCRHWREALFGTDAVILPLPATHDSRHLYMGQGREDERAPQIADIIGALPAGVFLAGGRMSDALVTAAVKRGFTPFDYFKSEALQRANALPTAEGAVFILMQEVPRTVSGLSVLITGFGRIGEALAGLLLAMGASVTVAARRADARERAAMLGCHTVDLTQPDAFAAKNGSYTAIFNTVPARLFDDDTLAMIPSDTLLIDLASAPGGIDAEAAACRGIRTVWALSLPGKYAPLTAGELIAGTVEAEMVREGLL